VVVSRIISSFVDKVTILNAELAEHVFKSAIVCGMDLLNEAAKANFVPAESAPASSR